MTNNSTESTANICVQVNLNHETYIPSVEYPRSPSIYMLSITVSAN